MHRAKDIASGIAIGMWLAVLIVLLPGCDVVQPQNTWIDQNDSFHEAIVEGVLWPAYETHPDVSDADRANVRAAIDKHRAFLDDIAADAQGGAEGGDS